MRTRAFRKSRPRRVVTPVGTFLEVLELGFSTGLAATQSCGRIETPAGEHRPHSIPIVLSSDVHKSENVQALVENQRFLIVLGPSWDHLGPSWAISGASWAILGLSWAVLGPSWVRLGAVWGRLGPSRKHRLEEFPKCREL